jgi:L-alanine-DL-glutamate epimerase-like enolase superfamily enzyme
MRSCQVNIDHVAARAYEVPTEAPKADGTFRWRSTTMVVVEVTAGGACGLGFTYGAGAGAQLVRETLAPPLIGENALDIPRLRDRMVAALRNIGRPGLASTALSAVDLALWDLKARLLDLPLAVLLGRRRASVPIYGSGGFTTYEPEHLNDRLARWAEETGCRWVKMKVGETPQEDAARVASAARAIGEAGLMVDANGAYERKFALRQAERFAEHGVSWFEEPVSSDDLDGLRLLRERLPAPMELAAGEYAYEPFYVLRMLQAQAVDVIQLDATRLGGITGFLKCAELADAHHVPVSSHTAPALHVAVGCAAPGMRHIEWFDDHARIEAMLLDGAPRPSDGAVAPDLTRPGHGLEFKRQDAERFAA